MKLAVTGGAGFLGYHICAQLKDEYKEIYVLDIAPIDPKEYPKNAKYFHCDVRKPKQLDKIFKKVDVVVHAAAALPLWKKDEIFKINVDGTKNVLKTALKNKIKRVVFISSTAVYGVPEKHPIFEDAPLIGVGPYGESKIKAEKICLDFRKKGIYIPIIRPKTFIGTGRLGVFQILYDWVESGKRIPVIGNGKNRYQLLEVEDLVNAIYSALATKSNKGNDTFNVGAEKFDKVEKDVGALCRYAKAGATVLPIASWLAKPPLIAFEKLKLSPLYKWVYDTADKDSFVSTEKIKKKLGWSAKYSNSQALIKSYKWYLDHKDELSGSGITHRVAWNQGILALIKKFM